MKKYNIKRLVKIKLNIVGADASVRLEKNQNRNNIKTFDEHKLNAVGVGVPDDPQIEQKHINKITSNNSTSNIKFPTSNAAITLITLIITTIVLLILAGVTLNMVMGENGLFGKANNAKNKTEVAQYEEELRMCVLELQTDAATNGETFNMETIKNKFVEKVKELENTTEIEFPTEESETRLDGTYKGYEFYIDDKYAAHIGNKATGIILTTSLEPEGWTNQNVTATIIIKSNNGINKVEPDEGSKNGNEYIITKENIAENTSFEYTVTDGQGNTQTKTAVIDTIDKNPPADFTITAESTEEGLKITGEATDAESGIDKYEYYVMKSTDSDYTKYDSNIITSLSNGTYDIKVIAYDKAENQKAAELKSFEVKKEIKRTNISAQDIKNNPEGYYGQTVDYTSANGQNDWKIFHSDGTNIYLITGNYVKVTGSNNSTIDTNKLNAGTNMQIVEGGQNYRVKWNSSNLPSFNADVSSDIISKFKINTSIFNINSKKNNTSYPNAQCVLSLLNPSYWTGYIDNSKGNNQTAIGGPTVELWMDSWNARYPGQEVYCDSANANGYYVGKSSGSTTDNINLNKNENNGGELYFANNFSALTDGNYPVNYYWLASPSAIYSDFLLYVYYSGGMSNSGYNYNGGGVRPVVCLQSNISLK